MEPNEMSNEQMIAMYEASYKEDYDMVDALAQQYGFDVSTEQIWHELIPPGYFNELDDAKAACQAHHTQHVLSMIEVEG